MEEDGVSSLTTLTAKLTVSFQFLGKPDAMAYAKGWRRDYEALLDAARQNGHSVRVEVQQEGVPVNVVVEGREDPVRRGT